MTDDTRTQCRVCFMFYVLPMTPGTAQSWRGSLFRKPCRRYHASGWSAYPYTMTRHTRTLARFVPSERVQQRKRNDTPNTQRKSHRRRVSHLQRHAVRFCFLRLQYIRATVHMLSVCPSMTTDTRKRTHWRAMIQTACVCLQFRNGSHAACRPWECVTSNVLCSTAHSLRGSLFRNGWPMTEPESAIRTNVQRFALFRKPCP